MTEAMTQPPDYSKMPTADQIYYMYQAFMGSVTDVWAGNQAQSRWMSGTQYQNTALWDMGREYVAFFNTPPTNRPFDPDQYWEIEYSPYYDDLAKPYPWFASDKANYKDRYYGISGSFHSHPPLFFGDLFSIWSQWQANDKAQVDLSAQAFDAWLVPQAMQAWQWLGEHPYFDPFTGLYTNDPVDQSGWSSGGVSGYGYGTANWDVGQALNANVHDWQNMWGAEWASHDDDEMMQFWNNVNEPFVALTLAALYGINWLEVIIGYLKDILLFSGPILMVYLASA